MSTISKLNPEVRENRSWRRATVRRLHNASAILFNRGKVSEGAVVQLLANWATRVARCPSLSGDDKQAMFLTRIPQEI